MGWPLDDVLLVSFWRGGRWLLGRETRGYPLGAARGASVAVASQ